MSREPKYRVLLIIAILFVTMIPIQFSHTNDISHIGNQSPPANAPPPPKNATVYITPSNVTDLTLKSGPITFGVYANDTPSINLFSVSIQYNRTALSVKSVNSAGNILGPDAQVVYYCVDGVNQENSQGQCLTYNGYPIDQPGVVTYQQNLLGTSSSPAQNALLFNITFNILRTGLSQLHIMYLVLGNGTSTEVPSTSRDAFLANGKCGGSVCRAPSLNMTLSPPIFSVGSPGSFNATVVLRNPPIGQGVPDSVMNYTWYFGETSSLGGQGYAQNHVPWAAHAYLNALDYIVSLTIVDSYGVNWYATIRVHVTRLYVAVYVGEITADPQLKVTPGTPVHITAVITNNSTLAEDTTFSITIERSNILKTSPKITLAADGGHASLDTVWNTAGLTPRVYAVVVIIPPIPNENTTSGNVGIAYVLLVSAPPSGLLTLSILQTTGLSILIVIGIAVALSRFLRKPSYETEPL